MPLYGTIAAAIAGVLHVVFFLFESVLFSRPKIQKRFNVEPSAAEAVRPWAYNQGFYNLFLAIAVFAGIFTKNNTMVMVPCACMVGAGVVLATTNKRMLRAAAMQALPPLVALISIAI